MNFDALKKRNEIAKVDMVIGRERRLFNTTIIKRFHRAFHRSPEPHCGAHRTLRSRSELLKFMYEPPLFKKFFSLHWVPLF